MPVPESLSTAKHQDFDLKLVDGVWPENLSGDLLFSSPNQTGNLPFAVHDWGAICRLSLDSGTRGASAGQWRWQARDIETPGKRLFDLHPEAFTPGPTGYTSPLGAANSSNTAPLPWGKRLFTTWDAGRPVELDPETLEFVAEVGHIDSWGGPSLPIPGVLPFLLSSAHPVADPDRDCLWTVKMDVPLESPADTQPILVRWNAKDGHEVDYWPLDGITFNGSLHTVSQTRDWIVMSDSGNFKIDMGEMLGGERTEKINERVPVWLIRKDAVENLPSGTPITPISYEVAPPSGHFYANWDDSDGISVVWEGMDLMDLAFYLRPGDNDVNGNPINPKHAGLYNMAMGPESICEMQFDPSTGKVTEKAVVKDPDWTYNLQLSAMDWSTEGLENPTLHHVVYQGCRPANISGRAATLYEDRIDRDLLREETPGVLATFQRGSLDVKSRYEFSDTSDHITSPTFVPRDPGESQTSSSYAGSEPGGHDGYVVLPVLNDSGLRVEVFDAADTSAGPIATLAGTNSECVPLILHSAWMPTAGGLTSAERMPFSAEVNDETLAMVPQEFHDSVRKVAADCDELL